MSKEKPLVNKKYLLEKFPGKGGWTYAAIPEVIQSKRIPFGWVRVKGSIDNYEINRYKLMPMGNNLLFLPVNAQIRKSIKKEAGDYVKIMLYKDEPPEELYKEVLSCFKNEPPEIHKKFLHFSPEEQQDYISWIYDAKNDNIKEERIVEMMKKVEQGLRLYDLSK